MSIEMRIEMLIKNKMSSNGLNKSHCVLTDKRTGREYIVHNYGMYDEWFLYDGCDLIVGDTTFDNIIDILVEIANCTL